MSLYSVRHPRAAEPIRTAAQSDTVSCTRSVATFDMSSRIFGFFLVSLLLYRFHNPLDLLNEGFEIADNAL